MLLGVAFANLFMGIPIDVKGVYHGNLLGLLNIYGLAGGVFFLCMFLLHGSLWLAIKSTGSLQTRAVASATFLWPVMLLLLVVFLVLTAMYTKLYANFLAMLFCLFCPCWRWRPCGRARHAGCGQAVAGLGVQRRVHSWRYLLWRCGHVPRHDHIFH